MKKFASLMMIGVLALPLTVSTLSMAQDTKGKKDKDAAASTDTTSGKKKSGKKKSDKKGDKKDKGAKKDM